MARQRFIQETSELDPVDLKTLAQFNLLGDPSTVPFVAATAAPAAPKGRRRAIAPPRASAAVTSRRQMLRAVGDALQHTAVTCRDAPRARPTMTRAALAALLGRHIPSTVTIRSFDAAQTAAPAVRLAAAMQAGPQAHVAFVPGRDRRGDTLVVVRQQPGGEPEVRTAVRR
jgi:hypothetical protein